MRLETGAPKKWLTPVDNEPKLSLAHSTRIGGIASLSANLRHLIGYRQLRTV